MTHRNRWAWRRIRGTRVQDKATVLDHYFGLSIEMIRLIGGLHRPEFDRAERDRRRTKGRVAKAARKRNRGAYIGR